MILTGGNGSTGRKSFPTAIVSTSDPTRTTPGSNSCFRVKIYLNNTYKSSSYLADNTFNLHYKDNSVTDVWEDKLFVVRIIRRHKYAVCVCVWGGEEFI